MGEGEGRIEEVGWGSVLRSFGVIRGIHHLEKEEEKGEEEEEWDKREPGRSEEENLEIFFANFERCSFEIFLEFSLDSSMYCPWIRFCISLNLQELVNPVQIRTTRGERWRRKKRFWIS